MGTQRWGTHDDSGRGLRRLLLAAAMVGAFALSGCSDVQGPGMPPAVGDGASEPAGDGGTEPSDDGGEQGESPVPGDFPNADTTGVPAGTELTPSGPITVTRDGTVIDGKEVTGGIVVNADDVTIRNTLIKVTGRNAIKMNTANRNLVVEDTEIDGQGAPGPAIITNNYTLRRVDIHSISEGPRLQGNNVVEDSFIHHLVRCPECHIDALQSTGGSNITIRNNSIATFNPDTRDPHNAAYQFGEEHAPLRNVTVTGNYVDGGNFTINGGGGGTTGAQVVFRNNRFFPNARYGGVAHLGSGVSFDESNVWIDTGEPVTQNNNRRRVGW
jgi:hypothetical protein